MNGNLFKGNQETSTTYHPQDTLRKSYGSGGIINIILCTYLISQIALIGQINNPIIPEEYQIKVILEDDSIEGSFTKNKFYNDTLLSTVIYKNYEPYIETYRNNKYFPFDIELFNKSGYFIDVWNGIYDGEYKKHRFNYSITNYNNLNKSGLSFSFYEFNIQEFQITNLKLIFNSGFKLDKIQVKSSDQVYNYIKIDDNIIMEWDYLEPVRIYLYYDKKIKSIPNTIYDYKPEIRYNSKIFYQAIKDRSKNIIEVLDEIEKNMIDLNCSLFKVSYKLSFEY